MIIGIDASRAAVGQRTGTEAYAYHLIQAIIPQAAARGHQLRLYFNQPDPALLDIAGNTDHVEPVIIPFPRLWTHLRLGRELRRRPPDLFFTPAHVIPLGYNGPSAATVHDLGYYFFPEAHTRSQLLYLRWSTHHNAHRSRCIIADSEATRTDLVRLIGVSPEKIAVVYPGLTPGLGPVGDLERLAAVQRRYGITPPYLLFLSTLQPRKNLIRLIQAYAASDVPHQLILAGKKGWHAGPILEAIATLPAATAERIHLPGYVDEADKAALLTGATALLYPSLYEGFGFPVLEGQACGTAVLCANNSSLPEVAGDAALLVEATDTSELTAAIRQIVADEGLRRQLIARGRENVRRFTWAAAAEQIITNLEAAV